MYDNLLHQNAAEQLEQDITQNTLPGALLFSGPQGSGKLTAALETARVLSCTGEPRGEWMCACPSCRLQKELSGQTLMLAGPRDCTLEIAAAANILIQAHAENSQHLRAVRYLFLRSVRKLTLRFNQVLWQDDDKLSKIAAVISAIDEQMELIDFPRELPSHEELTAVCGEIQKLCEKLESDFLYDSIPVRQIRNISAWARIKSADGRKTVIIENADRMLESVRNALLKILEEPPENTVFILTTSRRSAVMPTILSRVRTYQFPGRERDQEHDVIGRVFHCSTFTGSIQEYLETFLPVQPKDIRRAAADFFSQLADNKLPDCGAVIKECGAFEPRTILRIFLAEIAESEKNLMFSAQGADAAAQLSDVLRSCWTDVSLYNQSPLSALENMVREISKINHTHGGCLKTSVQ